MRSVTQRTPVFAEGAVGVLLLLNDLIMTKEEVSQADIVTEFG